MPKYTFPTLIRLIIIFSIYIFLAFGDRGEKDYENKIAMDFDGTVSQIFTRKIKIYTININYDSTFELSSMSDKFNKNVQVNDRIIKKRGENSCTIIRPDTMIEIPYTWIP